jgi:hypothetical protein
VTTHKVKKRSPALTEEGREKQMIAMAIDLAEQQLLDGTASSQVITHFLKLGTEKAKLENEKLKAENEMLKAKKEALESTQRMEELYTKAVESMRKYTGNVD